MNKNNIIAVNMITNVLKLGKCALKSCDKLYKLAEKDVQLKKLKIQLKEEKDIKNIEKIIIKINNNKKTMEYQKCLFDNCLTEIKELLKTIIDFIKIKNLKPDPKLIKNTNKLIKKKKLNKDEIKELSKNYLILLNHIEKRNN